MRSLLVVAGLASTGFRIVTAQADVTAPRLIQGKNWRGIDGNWSTVPFWVRSAGTSDVDVDLLVSTTLSEAWVVNNGGCLEKEQLCNKFRGGTVDTWKSSTWKSLGNYALAVLSLDVQAWGNYGLDFIYFKDQGTTHELVGVDNALIAAINTTEFYNGFFGLGITTASLGPNVEESPFSKMVKDYGWFPSYSYGYTAGAYYKGSGMPSSLTLGGYDASRLVPHNIDFTLERNVWVPRALVRGIEVSLPKDAEKPGNWASNTQRLSMMNQSFEANIDTTTSFLWLPEAVCENFVTALNLTYDKELDAYVFDNNQFDKMNADNSYTFTFSLSSYDNLDDFGHPLDVSGVVNITLSAHAFAQRLAYPYKGEAIKYTEPSVPYFPLKKALNDSFILGRTFLQESYLVTKYDSDVFSIHQAAFPDDPDKAANIKTIERPANSRYPAPKPISRPTGLDKNQMIGIIVGTVLSIAALATSCCLWQRRKRKRQALALAEDDGKDTASSIMPETPRTPVSRIFSKIIRRKKSRKAESVDAAGTATNPAEVGADANHELFELPAPIGPVELDADTHSLNGDTELGTEGSQNLSAYDVARRKLERQLQGPVPAYSPSAAGGESTTGEKSMQDISPVETYRPSAHTSPTSSPIYANSNSLPQSLPSPMSPHPDWNTRGPDLPSPLTVAPPLPSPIYTGSGTDPSTVPLPSSRGRTYDPSAVSRSNSAHSASPVSPSGSLVPPSPLVQRTPIDPSRIVCLGPLPENVRLPSQPSLPRLAGTNSRSPPVRGMNSRGHTSTDTLGSNFTDVEEQIAEEVKRQASVSPIRSQRSTNPPNRSNSHPQHTLESPRSQERIDGGSELIHVPQMAERRYSWED